METALKLYELTGALEQIGAELTENGGELTAELEAKLNSLEWAFDAKVERTALYIRSLEATAAAAQAESKRLAELASSRENAAKRLKAYLLENMVRVDQRKVETPLIKVRVQNNGRPAIKWLKPVELAPAEFVRVRPPEIDGDAAYKAWKASGELPEGFDVQTGMHLRIQ